MSIAGHTKTLKTSPCGLARGARVEIPPGSDTWMRGARFGTVTRVYRYWRDGLGASNSFDRVLVAVRMDNPRVKRLQRFEAIDCMRART